MASGNAHVIISERLIIQLNFLMRISYQPPKADNEFYQARAVIVCHPERSEGSVVIGRETLRCAQDDSTDFGR